MLIYHLVTRDNLQFNKNVVEYSKFCNYESFIENKIFINIFEHRIKFRIPNFQFLILKSDDSFIKILL